jgi:hypothetical protein
MPRVGWREPLAHEYMAKVGTAIRTLDLYSHAIRVRQVTNSPFDLFVERRPSAVSVKFID